MFTRRAGMRVSVIWPKIAFPELRFGNRFMGMCLAPKTLAGVRELVHLTPALADQNTIVVRS